MKRIHTALLSAISVGVFVIITLLAFGLGAVVGKFQPSVARPFSDWAMVLIRPLRQPYCDVDDVTTCGVANANRQQVSCEPFTARDPRTAILLTFGQSNSANFGETRYRASKHVSNFNLHDGKCYRSEDPLFGADGNGGSPWGYLGDSLVASGNFDRVLIVPFGIGGTAISEWTTGGRLHPRVAHAAQQLKRAGIEPSHVLWHQGENDARDGTAEEDYIEMFAALVNSLREYGVNAPVFPAVASLCNDLGSDAIRSAQRALPARIAGVHRGPDTDSLSDMRERFDYCHFSEAGLIAHAELWKEVILDYEEKQLSTTGPQSG